MWIVAEGAGTYGTLDNNGLAVKAGRRLGLLDKNYVYR